MATLRNRFQAIPDRILISGRKFEKKEALSTSKWKNSPPGWYQEKDSISNIAVLKETICDYLLPYFFFAV